MPVVVFVVVYALACTQHMHLHQSKSIAVLQGAEQSRAQPRVGLFLYAHRQSLWLYQITRRRRSRRVLYLAFLPRSIVVNKMAVLCGRPSRVHQTAAACSPKQATKKKDIFFFFFFVYLCACLFLKLLHHPHHHRCHASRLLCRDLGFGWDQGQRHTTKARGVCCSCYCCRQAV